MVRTELVGRERELAVLDECLVAALDGQPRIVLCQGEPGIGKTRLAEETAERARVRRVPVAWGRAVDSDGAPPFWPWRQLLRTVAEVVDVAGLAEKHHLAVDVSRLAPDVFPTLDQGAGTGSAEDRFKQFDAVGRLLRHVSVRTPLLVILEDVHWADRPSLLLLQHVARALSDERLLFVVNHRHTEQRHSAIVSDLAREPVTRQLHLVGLPSSDVGRQLVSVLGHEVSEDDAEEVRALTGGNPFFVGEMARALGDPRATAGGATVTASLRDAIGTRLHRLSPEAVRMLQAASVVGREFPLPVVAAMVDRPVGACLGFLDEAVAAGLVENGPTPGRHQFLHALVRDAVEAGLPTSERVRLHRRAAESVEEAYAGRLEPHLFDLARHWSVAAVQGERATAAGWLRRAAQEAMRRLAFEDAARLFRLGLDVGGAELPDAERCRLLLGVGAALHEAADVDGRLDACLGAAAIARRIERPDLVAEAALILEGVFGHPESDFATRRLCEEAMAGLEPEHSVVRARVEGRYAEACMYLGDVDSAGPASEKALALAEECGDRGALVAALHARRLVCEGPDGVEERQRLAERMVALGREDGSPRDEMWGRLWRVDASFERGDLVAAAQELDALTLLAQEVGGPWAQWQLLRGQAVLAQARARFGDARRLAAAFEPIALTGHPIAGLPRAGLLQSVGHHTGHSTSSPSLTCRTAARSSCG